MTTPTDARPDLVTVIAHMRAKPGKDFASRLDELLEGELTVVRVRRIA